MTAQPMTPEHLDQVMAATWPAAQLHRVGPWTVRDGQGGGQRVSATTADGDWSDEDIPVAEAAMARLGQGNLFLIRAQDGMLDQALQARGYRIKDPVLAYAAPAAELADPAPPGMAAFAHWPPLAICRQIWDEAGIGPARIAVMERVMGPKCTILARSNDHPTGVAFVALHENTAMLHALEVVPTARRQGSAHNMLRAAAVWAQQNGADRLSLVVTVANAPARALYASLNMEVVGDYHYRQN